MTLNHLHKINLELLHLDNQQIKEKLFQLQPQGQGVISKREKSSNNRKKIIGKVKKMKGGEEVDLKEQELIITMIIRINITISKTINSNHITNNNKTIKREITEVEEEAMVVATVVVMVVTVVAIKIIIIII